MIKLNEQSIRKIISGGENDRVEFKAVVPDTSTFVKNVSALANTQGGAIIVGIREPNVVVGTQPQRVIDLIERSRNALSPLVDLDVATVTIDNKTIAVITVPSSPQVVFANGLALKRVGDCNLALAPSEIVAKLRPEPDSQKIDRLTESVSKLTETVEQQNKTIDELRKQQQVANSLQNKAIDYILSGIVGAIIGALITAMLK
jgi:predicted HTH transcriptional regulator